MTAVIGVLCSDGIVIGTDGSATFSTGSMPTIEQPTEKLRIVDGRVILAGTGSVGFSQRFNRIVQDQYQNKLFSKADHIEACKVLSRAAIEDFRSTYMNPGKYGALLGFAKSGRPYLCEFAVADFQPEFKDKGIWYVSMGSGQSITDPFLGLMRSVFWRDGMPSIQEATFVVTWALDHAVEVNPGGINEPIQIAVLELDRKGNPAARVLSTDELQEHRSNILGTKSEMQKFVSAINEEASVPSPQSNS